MNVVFHVYSAVAIAASLPDMPQISFLRMKTVHQTTIIAFISGVLMHGCLDFLPHTYPVNSKLDVVLGLWGALGLIYFAQRKYKVLVAASLLGCIFPDIIDLSGGILNHYLNLHLPVLPKLFPWHWLSLSGSIYSGGFVISLVDHIMVLTAVAIICFSVGVILK